MLNAYEISLVLEVTAGLPESEILKALDAKVDEARESLKNCPAALVRNGINVVDWTHSDAVQAQMAIEIYNKWSHILSSVAINGFHRPVKLINAFSPNEQDLADIARIKATGEYKLRCWLPESIMSIGDTWVYYNDSKYIEPEWLRHAVEQHPCFVQYTWAETYSNQK